MFRMTCDITIGPFKPFKPTGFTWQHSVDSYTNTATITVPAIARMVRRGEVYSNVNTAQQFAEGMPVAIWAGYNGVNTRVFDGFVSRVKYNVPLQIECEGYSYLLRTRTFTASYPMITIPQLLAELVKGTPITIHPATVVANVGPVRFGGVSGSEVLEWLKKQGMKVWFAGRQLYVGLEQLQEPHRIAYRLNWNTIGDDGLNFTNMPRAVVNFRVDKKNTDGTRQRNKGPLRPGEKVKHTHIELTTAQKEQLERTLQQEEMYKGLDGQLNTFLWPMAYPTQTAVITDGRFPERSGHYFIQAVQGSFDQSGGRLAVKLGRRLNPI